ncbi:MAG TPA: hypothetical protein VIY51_21595 [Xanthobacteraceae bacterium]
MRIRLVHLTLLAGLAGLAAMATFAARSVAQQPAQQPPQEEQNPADAAPQPFNPQVAALMSMIIQPRHAKIALAGKAENWPLAGYEFKQLQQGFQVVARAAPRYKGLPVGELIDAALKQPFAVLDFAIKAGDSRQFNEAFGRVTAGCNACHTTTDNPFVVIKTPDANNFSNQEFEPGKR